LVSNWAGERTRFRISSPASIGLTAKFGKGRHREIVHEKQKATARSSAVSRLSFGRELFASADTRAASELNINLAPRVILSRYRIRRLPDQRSPRADTDRRHHRSSRVGHCRGCGADPVRNAEAGSKHCCSQGYCVNACPMVGPDVRRQAGRRYGKRGGISTDLRFRRRAHARTAGVSGFDDGAQAVAVAGGFSLLRSRGHLGAIDPADLVRDYESLATEYVKEYFHVVRIDAELDAVIPSINPSRTIFPCPHR